MTKWKHDARSLDKQIYIIYTYIYTNIYIYIRFKESETGPGDKSNLKFCVDFNGSNSFHKDFAQHTLSD